MHERNIGKKLVFPLEERNKFFKRKDKRMENGTRKCAWKRPVVYGSVSSRGVVDEMLYEKGEMGGGLERCGRKEVKVWLLKKFQPGIIFRRRWDTV